MKCRLILDNVDDNERYSDGDDEGRLLEFFRSAPSLEGEEQFLAENAASWPIHYHLSPVRHNLLSWFPFAPDSTLLEVGAGCGALTGLFAERCGAITAVELTRRRAEILAHRHRDRGNLTVFAGNLTRIPLEQRFDYVTSIGVLEYAGRFSKGTNPFSDFLSALKARIAPGGALILAIENRYGIKYWSGGREDHTARLFDSIEGYPQTDEIRTFGRRELEEMMRTVGFSEATFYYPFPDYKLPEEIFSDGYQPSENHRIRAGIFPTHDHSHPREYLFDEARAMIGLQEQGMFPFFANSFLVIAR